MARYIVTIAGADADEDDTGAPEVILWVNAEGGRAYMEEVTMRALRGTELAPDGVPPVDLSMLVRAFAQRSADERGDEQPMRARLRSSHSPSAGGDRRVKRVRLAAHAEPGSIDHDTSAGALPGDRAYRRMPDVASLKAAYARTHTITGLAAHFGVPRHTAQGWVTRLRRKGIAIT